MNSQLIADVVHDSKSDAEATLWGRLYAFWLRRLVYTQIWEDPVADLAALRLPLGSTIVTISSGGCNALSYLMAQPAQVYAVDLNGAHLALLKLKLAGLRAFSNYSDFWQFFGEASSPANSHLYRERLRPLLDAQARNYWDKRNIIGRPRHAYYRRILPPRHARPVHRPCASCCKIVGDRSGYTFECQAGCAGAD
jgi:S-adenosylmethionine-diacylglycerol 3-amino-3-carboxypropyl transferase